MTPADQAQSAPVAIAAIADDPKAVFIVTLARELHVAGVATDALESTLTEVAHFIDLPMQVFALPTYITIAFGTSWDQKVVMMRLDPGRVSLRKIALLNLIYDDLRRGRIDYQRASRLLETIDQQWPARSAWWEIPSLGLVALGVAIILGGGAHELLVATTIGLCTGVITALSRISAFLSRIYQVAASFVSTLVVAAYAHTIGPSNVYISIVAGIVVLLPGYSLTLALYELANGNLVAGVARLGKVLSTLLELGCGAFLGFAVLGQALLTGGNVATHPVPAWLWFLAAICMAAGLASDLDARARDLAWVFAASVVALLMSHLIGGSSAHAVTAFASSFVCGVVANIGARWLRVPQPIMLVPALIVLVPGSLGYESVLFAFQDNINSALTLAANAASAAIQLVAGLLLSQLLFPASTLRTKAGITSES